MVADEDEIARALRATEERAERALGFFPPPQWALDTLVLVRELRRLRAERQAA